MVVNIDEEKQQVLDYLATGSQIVMDTNMYIYYYEYQMNIVPQKQCQDKITKESVIIIFNYFIKNKIPICLPKIIYDEVRKVMSRKRAEALEKGKDLYQYNEDILYWGLTLCKDLDEDFESKNRKLANDIFFDQSNDFLIYIYCKEKNKEMIITENTDDFDECEIRYDAQINKNQTKIKILSIAQCADIINS